MRIDGCALEECQFSAQMRAVGAMVHSKFSFSGLSGQAVIAAYKIEGQQLFFPNAGK